MPRRGRDAGTELFGKEVRRMRLELHLTLDQLAQRAGITRSYLAGVERGARNPTLSIAGAIAKGLNTTVGDLLGGHSEVGRAGQEAMILFEATEPEVQHALLLILRALAQKRRQQA